MVFVVSVLYIDMRDDGDDDDAASHVDSHVFSPYENTFVRNFRALDRRRLKGFVTPKKRYDDDDDDDLRYRCAMTRHF